MWIIMWITKKVWITQEENVKLSTGKSYPHQLSTGKSASYPHYVDNFCGLSQREARIFILSAQKKCTLIITMIYVVITVYILYIGRNKNEN